tara:strand:+ start:208 stop:636 length:429 start_codon:yes stop_codon:yes gene_type:complete
MARSIKITEVGQHVKGKYEKLITAAVAETYKSLVQKSPVASGRFRTSWAVGENDASFSGEPAGQSSYPAPNPNQPRKIGYQKERIGNVYSVYNNLPYAERLETASLGKGSSTQTNGPGWVRATAKRVQSIIPTLAARIEAES